MARTTALIWQGLVSAALLVLLTLIVSHIAFNRRARREAEVLLAQAGGTRGRIVTEAMLNELPRPVRRYLIYAGVVGKPIPRTVRLKQVGKIRLDVGSSWTPLDAEQYYTVDPPTFVWIGTMRMAGLPVVRVRDRYAQGAGGMLIKLASLITIADASGEEMDQGAQMRYLNEVTAWFPAALLGANVSFEPVDKNSAQVTLTVGGKSITATLHVDDEGKLTDFVAPRYRSVKGGFELETWSTPMTAYGEFQGLNLPVKGQAVWKLKGGDFAYIDLAVIELEYDADRLY